MTDALAAVPRSPWRDARVRLLRNRAAIVAIFVLGAIAAACILVPSFAQWPLDEVDWSSIQAPPSAEHLLGTSVEGLEPALHVAGDRALYG